MSSKQVSRRARPGKRGSDAKLALALEQSHGVKLKVEACAEDLSSSNDGAARQIAEGATLVSARAALVASQAVEGTVEECAADLAEVTETLARGIAEREDVTLALRASEVALADTTASLEASRAEEQKARLRAMHDSATGLPNRELFDDRLAQSIALAARQGWDLAVLFVDLNEFKRVNDEHGHAAGDLVLKEVAARLARGAREADTVCRTGGDEFLLLLVEPRGRANIERLAEALVERTAQPIDAAGMQLVVSVSVGIAIYPGDALTGADLVARADVAMYRAKRASKGTLFFDAPDAA